MRAFLIVAIILAVSKGFWDIKTLCVCLSVFLSVCRYVCLYVCVCVFNHSTYFFCLLESESETFNKLTVETFCQIEEDENLIEPACGRSRLASFKILTILAQYESMQVPQCPALHPLDAKRSGFGM